MCLVPPGRGDNRGVAAKRKDLKEDYLPRRKDRVAAMKEDTHALRLSGAEGAFLGAVVLAWGGIALFLGKDADWDFFNYHWYNPYAFLNGRMGIDVAAGHHATYLNPLPDIPFYLLATALSSWVAVFFLGAAQGLNVVPLYLISKATLALPYRRWGAGLIALLGLAGSMAGRLIGKNNNDNLLSVLVLSALAIVVCAQAKLVDGGRKGLLWVALAGFLAGGATGLKLVEAIFAVGFAAALLVVPGPAPVRLARLAVGGLGGILGVLVFGGFWFVTLAKFTGNPLFPYFNDLFASPLVLDASYRDMRFLPHGLGNLLSFPFRFSFDYHVADDMPFRDFRVLAAYVAVPLACGAWVLGRSARDSFVSKKSARILFAFAGASYVAWILTFAIYRYITVLEMLAPLLLVAAIGLLPIAPRWRLAIAGAMLLAIAATTRYDFGPRAPLGDPYVEIKGPVIPDPAHTIILMTGFGEPAAFIIPELPPEIPVLRISGFLAGPNDGSRLTATMQARVRAHRGALYLLTSFGDNESTADAIAAYGLVLDEARCGSIETNISRPYRFCPLERKQSAAP